MKAITPILLAALAASALTAGAFEFLYRQRLAESRTGDTGREAVQVASAAAAPATEPGTEAATLVDPTLRGSLDELAMRLTSIESRLASLERRPATVPEELLESPDENETAALESDPQARDFILSVVNDQQEAEEAEERARVREMLETRLRERVATMAAELGLSPHDENVVYDVLLAENTQRTELFESVRRDGFMPGSREAIREELGTLRDWKRDELTRQLGPNLADQVLEQDPSPWGRERRPDGERRRREEGGRGG